MTGEGNRGFRERRFTWLLRLLPASFREDHERELLRVWRDELRDAGREGRRGVWLTAFVDTLRVAPREHAATWWRNLRFAARSLRRSPSFAVAAILTLAVGTGATTAVFTLVNAVLLRPLPWLAPDRVGIVWAIQPTGEQTWLSFPESEELRRDIPAFQAAAAYTDLRPTLLLDGVGHEVQALAVSHRFFGVLGVQPRLGRDFTPQDDEPGAARSVILSDGFWRTQFGADPAIVGRLIRLSDVDYSVIGVLPRAFTILPASSVLPERVDLWVSLEPHLPSRDRSVRFLQVLARIRAGASFAEASQQLQAYAASANAADPTVYRGGFWRFTVTSFADDVLRNARTALYVISALVALVLLIACANVANLLLARGEARRSEIAVRTALGAGPARLAGELLAEAFVLTAAGSVLALALTAVVPAILRTIDPGALPRLEDARIDRHVAAFVVGLIVLTTGLFAAVPLIERMRLRGASAAFAGRSGGRTRRAARLGRAFVVMQTAFATSVLIVACFLLKTFAELHDTDLGFAPRNLVTARITLSPRYTTATAADYFTSATGAVERVSGVAGAAAVTQLPLSGAMLGSTFIRERDDLRIDADLRGATPNYFAVIGAPLLQGRAFTADDRLDTAAVAIVDERFARRLAPDGKIIGQRIRWFRQPDVPIEIVGVVRAVRHRGPGDSARETVYRPHRQYPRTSMFVVARTSGDAARSAPAVQAALRAVDPTQPLADVSTMEQRLDRSISQVRTSFMLSATLAALALVLGVIGLYGILSFDIAQRRREFGIRMSLGASPVMVRRIVLKEGLKLTVAGLTIGSVGAAWLASLMRATFLATSPMDVRLYLLGAALVAGASLVALWVPARRASTADPIAVLRSE